MREVETLYWSLWQWAKTKSWGTELKAWLCTLCWRQAAMEAGTAFGGWQPKGKAILSWHCKDSVSSRHFEVWSSEAFLLVAVPQGCFCSPPTAALGMLSELLLLCIVKVMENFKTNVCQEHIISCGCPSHEFFTLLCRPCCTLLISDHASFSSLTLWSPG